jgi:hypothetical protein
MKRRETKAWGSKVRGPSLNEARDPQSESHLVGVNSVAILVCIDGG